MYKIVRPNVELGDEVCDSITGFKGVAVAITEWLNGCQRIMIQPKELKDGKPIEPLTFDTEQLIITKKADVHAEKHGGDRDDRAALSRN